MDKFDKFLEKFSIFLISPILKLGFAAAVVVFIISLVQYILALEDSANKKTYLARIFWSLIGFTILLSIVAIINTIQSTSNSIF